MDHGYVDGNLTRIVWFEDSSEEKQNEKGTNLQYQKNQENALLTIAFGMYSLYQMFVHTTT